MINTNPIIMIVGMLGAAALVAELAPQKDKASAPQSLFVSVEEIAAAPIGTVAVNFAPGRQYRFKFVGPSRTGLRQVVLCSDGSREDRSFVFDDEISHVEMLVAPDHPLYVHALADCARELGR